MKTPFERFLIFLGAITLISFVIKLLIMIPLGMSAKSKADTRSLIARTKAELRSLDNAYSMFYREYGVYPTSQSSRSFNDANAIIPDATELVNIAFPKQFIEKDYFHQVKDYFDPEGNTFRYNSDGETYYILVSNGPDQDIDLDERQYEGYLATILPYMYDISNGLKSSGDIINDRTLSKLARRIK